MYAYLFNFEDAKRGRPENIRSKKIIGKSFFELDTQGKGLDEDAAWGESKLAIEVMAKRNLSDVRRGFDDCRDLSISIPVKLPSACFPPKMSRNSILLIRKDGHRQRYT